MDSMKKYWISCIQNGNISSIVKDVKCFLMQDDAGCAAEKLLAELASSIHKKHIEYAGSAMDIHTFASVCCQAISSKDIVNELSYLRCLYHIIKHLIVMEDTASAFSLAEYIFLVKKSSISGSEALMNTCYSGCWVLRETLFKDAVSSLSHTALLDRGKLCMNILSCCGAKYLHVLLDTALKIDKLSDTHASDNSLKENLEFLTHSLKILVEAVKLTKTEYTSTPFLQKYIQLFLTIIKKDVLQNSPYFIDALNAVKVFSEQSKFENDEERLCLSVLCEVAAKGQPLPNANNLALKEFIDLLASKHSCKLGNTVAYTMSSMPFIFLKLLTAWSSWSAQEWQTVWNPSAQCAFYELTVKLLHVIYELLDSSGESIKNETTVVDSVLNLHRLAVKLVYHIFKRSVEVKLENLDMTIPVVSNILDFSCKWVLRLKDCGYENWKHSWEQLGPCYYNIAALLLNTGYSLYAKPIFLNVFKACLKLGSPIEGAHLHSGIFVIQCIAQQHDAIKEGLRLCAVCLLSFPDNHDKIFQLWVKLKCASSSDMEIQKYNLFNILVDEEETINSEFPGIVMDSCDINELLIAELQYYQPYSVRLWSSIESAALTLYALDPCHVNSSRGIDVYLRSSWQQSDTEKTKKALAMAKERITMLTRAEKESPAQEKVKILGFLGDICFTVYILELKSVQKSQQDIIGALKCSTEGSSRDTQGEATDVSNTVFTEHLSVSIEKERELMELLNKALHAWIQLLEHVNYITCDMQEFFKPILDSIEAASYFYGLNGCSVHQVYCWTVYYKLAVCLEMEDMKLHAISSLLKTGSFMPPESWFSESKIILLMDNNENCNSSQLCYYWLCKSFHHLRHGHYEEGFQLLHKVKDQLEHSSTLESELLQLELKFLSSIYLSTPAWKRPASYAHVDCISDGVATFRKIMEFIKHKRNDLKIHTRLLCLVMDVASWLVDIHLSLYWMCDVYQILRELLVITQIAGLSTRSAYILTVMAEIDVMRCSFANANVKLTALHSFYISKLWLQHSFNKPPDCIAYMQKLCDEMTNMSLKTSQKLEKIINFQLDNETRREIMLSTIVTRTCGKELSSPVCQHHNEKRLSVQPPSSYCQCYSCNNLLSHAVLLHYMMVMALFNYFSGNSKIALEFFEDGLSVCNSLYKIQKHCAQEMNQIMSYVVQGTKKNTLPSSLVEKIKTFVHHYAKFLSQYKKHEDAKALIQTLACFEEHANKSYCTLSFLEYQYALKLLSLGDNPLLDTTVYKSRAVDLITDIQSAKTPERAQAVLQLTPVMRYTSKDVDTEFRSNMHRLCRDQPKILFDMDEEADIQSSVNVREEKWQLKVQKYGDILNIEKSEATVPKCDESQKVLLDVDKNASYAITNDAVTPLRRQKIKSRQLSSLSSDEIDDYVSQLTHSSPLKENLSKNIRDNRDHNSSKTSNLKVGKSNQKLRQVKCNKMSKVRNIETGAPANDSDPHEVIPTTAESAALFKSPFHVPCKQKPKSRSKTLLDVGGNSFLAPRTTRQRKLSINSSEEDDSHIPNFLLHSPLKGNDNTDHNVTNIKKVAKRTTVRHKSTGIKIFSECSDGNSDCTEAKVTQHKRKGRRT